MPTLETNHALTNAASWYETISDQLARLQNAFDDGSDEAHDAICQEIFEAPLSLAVRSLWAEPGAEMEPGQFCILLTTGGPGLRIVGTLNRYNCPEDSRMEWQDWGQPWTEYPQADSAALDTWAAQFYWGD